uniref:Uncharacterized protein n=1 Tax=Parastrongyloides trichosuri TaxID=131310 RepID=A0A0N5A3X6_PARTI
MKLSFIIFFILTFTAINSYKNPEPRKKVFKRRHWITGTAKEEFINEIRNAVKPCSMPINLKTNDYREYNDNFVLEYDAIIQPHINKPICFSVSLFPKISMIHKITYLGYEDEPSKTHQNIAFKHETYRVINDKINLDQDLIKNITFLLPTIEINLSNGVNALFSILENERLSSEETDLLQENTLSPNPNISIKFIPDKNALQKNETQRKTFVVFFRK